MHLLARQHAVGARRVVAVLVRAARHHEKSDLAETQPVGGLGGEDGLDAEASRGRQGGRDLFGALGLDHADDDLIGRLVAEGDAQADGQEDREEEHPEHDLGLAHQLAQPREDQEQERVTSTHRAGACR